MKIFISYRRFDSSAYAGRIHDRLVTTYTENNVFKDVNDIPIGRDFRGVLSEEVAKCDVLLVLIGREWLDIRDEIGNRRLDNPGDFVRIEIRAGLQRGDDKCLVIPVLLSGAQMPQSNQLPDDMRELAYKNAVIIRDDPDFHRDMARLIDGLNKYADEINQSAEPPNVPPRPARRNTAIVSAIAAISILVVIGIVLRAIFSPTPAPSPTPSRTVVAERTDEPQVVISPPIATVPTLTSVPTATYTASPSPTVAPTLTALEQALARAQTSMTTNALWQAVYPNGFVQEFHGVPMVLAPRGCFTIGTNPQEEDEQDGNRRCFAPFWIDQTEVTQEQFQQLNGVSASRPNFSGTERPVENITWFEARNFCRLREAWLPTEAEWEYAARGPEELNYPWGNEWDSYRAVWKRTVSEGTANVGSIPEGASWIGAFDMSGNVWEWVNSRYADYPYGAANDNVISITAGRVLRGGSWYNEFSHIFRSANRSTATPSNASNLFGFRCARSID